MNKNSYRHKKYDETIMQTKTVENIVESLKTGIEYRNLREVVDFLIEKRELSLVKADKRKANSLDRKIERLKALGYVTSIDGFISKGGK